LVKRISLAVCTVFIMSNSLQILSLVIKVPLSFKEMWEDSCPERSELIENIREKSPVMYFKVETGLIGQSHDFFENEPYGFDKKWVDERINDFAMFVSWMLLKNDLVLYKKV